MSLLDILVDENNKEPLLLKDESGRTVTFDQLAVIPLREENLLFCILQPVGTKSIGIKEKPYVFRVVPAQDESEVNVKLEENRKLKKKVFSKYKELLKQKRR